MKQKDRETDRGKNNERGKKGGKKRKRRGRGL